MTEINLREVSAELMLDRCRDVAPVEIATHLVLHHEADPDQLGVLTSTVDQIHELVATADIDIVWRDADGSTEIDRLRGLLAFRDREIEGHRRDYARLRANAERLTDEVERLRESYVASQSAVLYHQTSAELLREHLAAARQGRVWPASAAPLPQRNPGQSADEVGEFPVLVQPRPLDVMETLRSEGDPS
jgi:hypothetical protein